MVDPHTRTVQWYARRGSAYAALGVSDLLGLTAEQVAAQIDWPG